MRVMRPIRAISPRKGPTRVVGRLPDLAMKQGPQPWQPTYLLGLLKIAATYKARNVDQYNTYFGLTTHSWQKSTHLSLTEIFGGNPALVISPPRGPAHGKALKSLSHFINCHGGDTDPNFYGEKKDDQPKSLTSKGLVRKISSGTVIAAECCYGAQMYDSVTLAIDLPICQRYLMQGAYGFFGSSTIAYGPAVGNGAADFITQYFLKAILEGASLGRAALLARQQFVAQTNELDPVDLKTLGQFSLLGDPSVTPAEVDSATSVPKGVDAAASQRQGRKERRAKMAATGKLLQETKPTASRKATSVRKSKAVSKALANIAREAGIGAKKDFTAFSVKTPKAARLRGTKAVPRASRYYVAVHRPKRAGHRLERDVPSVAVVAKEVSGRIVGYRIYMEKNGGQRRQQPEEGR